MKILFLPRYSRQGGSSRYRIWQYLPMFAAAGHTVEARPLVESAYLTQLYQEGRRDWRCLANGYARRILSASEVRRFDAVICEQEALPFMPALAEAIFQRKNVRLILDFDDAAHIKYLEYSLLRSKIPSLLRKADSVVVGNDYLRAYAAPFSRRISVIPTVVDIRRYPVRKIAAADGGIRIGWIGTPSTGKFLRSLYPVFRALQAKFPFVRFRFIGAGPEIRGQGFAAELVEWDEENEISLLGDCDIGIMPLPDTEFTRGKCGLKLIQYMACSMPTVASPVGANCAIVRDGETGFWATSADDWLAKLTVLIEDRTLRIEFGNAGRSRVEKHYTLERGFAQWQEVLHPSYQMAPETIGGLTMSVEHRAIEMASRKCVEQRSAK